MYPFYLVVTSNMWLRTNGFRRGDGWIVIDDQPTPVVAGQFVSVELHHRWHLRAGRHGLTFIAICAEQRAR